jgi:hypothetical protein
MSTDGMRKQSSPCRIILLNPKVYPHLFDTGPSPHQPRQAESRITLQKFRAKKTGDPLRLQTPAPGAPSAR